MAAPPALLLLEQVVHQEPEQGGQERTGEGDFDS